MTIHAGIPLNVEYSLHGLVNLAKAVNTGCTNMIQPILQHFQTMHLTTTMMCVETAILAGIRFHQKDLYHGVTMLKELA